MELTAARLRELLSYDPLTGQFIRIKALQGNAVGPLKGYIDRDGYVILKVDYKNRKAHRLAWLHVHGEWPRGVIDHINGCKTDNRIANLRDTTPLVNSQNTTRIDRRNTTGYRGVFRAYGGKFGAAIQANHRRQYLGVFDDPRAASAAYVNAKNQLHAKGTTK